MDHNRREILDTQKSVWNTFSPMWKKWDAILMDILRPMGERMAEALELKPGDALLDLASGTGEPGLSLAEKVHPGKAVLTDLSENMLEIARNHAERRGADNVEFRVCDASHLPFAAESFDAVSCRLGFMFFPDMFSAAQDIHRVLKRGGKVAVTVWDAPERNLWATAISSTVFQNLNVPPPPPEAPGLFRCARSGMLRDLFHKAGFENATETTVSGQTEFASFDDYWNMITEVTPPVAAALDQTDSTTKKAIRRQVAEQMIKRYPDGNIRMEAHALLITTTK